MFRSVYKQTAEAPFDKKAFGADIRERLQSNRDVFVIDADDWIYTEHHEQDGTGKAAETKKVSATTLRLLLDYCDNEWPGMDIVEYAAAIFHSRQPNEGETLFDVLPSVESRLSAASVGLGHIYGR